MSAHKKIEFGISRNVPSDSGWFRILEQEMVPSRVVDGPETPIALFERELPAWAEPFLRKGGIAVITGAEAAAIPWLEGYRGYAAFHHAHFPAPGLEDILLPACADLFNAEGWGEIRVHENRYTKNGIRNGRFPLLCRQSVGNGWCLFAGTPLTRLLTALGDTLRSFSTLTQVTERVSSIDKSKIARILTWSLQKAAELADIPYPHLWYYPEGAPSVFAFRVDVDGVHGAHLDAVSRAGVESALPISFFINKSMCQEHVSSIRKIDPLHEIGNHGDVHNLFDDEDANARNVEQCRAWLQSESIPNGPWYVAPRGMWNVNLGNALDALGYEYSSDFGLDFDGLPFFPRFCGRRLKLLQIPIHPYSVERAFRFSEETGQQEPEAQEILEYFKNVSLLQIQTDQPVFLYSHPERFGPVAAKVLPELKAFLAAHGAEATTLSRYCAWWKKRDAVRYEAEYNPDAGTLTVRGGIPSGVRLNVITSRPVTVHLPAGGAEALLNRGRLIL